MALDFSFTPEQEAFRQYVRDFANREIKPYVREWDEVEQLTVSDERAAIFGDAAVDREDAREEPHPAERAAGDDVKLEPRLAQPEQRRVGALREFTLVEEGIVEIEEQPAKHEGFVAVESGEGRHG